MASSVTSPEDVVNIALARVGYKGRVSNLFDGSPAAKKALDLYGQTRDATLAMRPWGFAERVLTLSAVGGATPPFPWTQEYVYPADCIKIRAMFAPSYGSDVNNPLPSNFTVANSGTAKVILAKYTGAVIVYTAQITDPSQWDDPDFVETLVSNLAKQLTPVMANLDATKMAGDDLKAALQHAEEGSE